MGMPGGWFRDPYVRIGARCYKNLREPDAASLMTEIKQALGDDAIEIMGHVHNIILSGADSANVVLAVYANYKAAELGIPP